MSIPNWKLSPNRISKGFSQIAFSMTVLPKDDHTEFRPRGTAGSSMLDHDFGHWCFGGRIQINGHSDFEIFNNGGASPIFDLGVS